MIDCLECRQEFPALKNLHSHLKKHGGQAAYYQKHYPRRDLLDGEMIFFENSEQYLSSFFNSVENQKTYLSECSKEEGRSLILAEILGEKKKKDLVFFPCENYLQLAELPQISEIKKFYGSCSELAAQSDLAQIYKSKLPKNFWRQNTAGMNVFVDTREQKPFSFLKSEVSKLDFGDYTASGEHYSQTFVDRKSLNDFRGTFGVGYSRFCEEAKRAQQFGSFLFVVIEATIDQIREYNERDKFKTNLSYAFHNVKTLMREYPDTVQFVFCPSRKLAQEVTSRLLFFGKQTWNCDIQYYINHGMV